jgi:hypothetical protein
MQASPTPLVQRIGVPKETFHGEKRVATVPDVVEKLIKLGFTVAVEAGAGDGAQFGDDTYRAAGAEVLPDAAALWAPARPVSKRNWTGMRRCMLRLMGRRWMLWHSFRTCWRRSWRGTGGLDPRTCGK